MVKKILIGVGVVIVLFLIVASFQPDAYQVTRSTSIAASPADVFAQVNDLHRMNEWSPWLKPDPQAQTSYEGAPAGEGAMFSWAGNSQVGEGRMTIVESRPNELVRIKLECIKPFESTADTEFTFQPEGDQTVVTWSMAGENNFVSKMMCVFISMDSMIGEQFELGLATMKSRVEGPAAS